MHARRLIAVPVVALAATLLVGAIIDSGQRARMSRAAGPAEAGLPTDPTLTAEAARVRQALESVTRCAGAAACTVESTAARVRREADSISTWPVDRRFGGVRDTLRDQLRAEAAVLDQRSAISVDGRASYASRGRMRVLEERLDAATLAALRAQRAAGLISRATFDALVNELR